MTFPTVCAEELITSFAQFGILSFDELSEDVLHLSQRPVCRKKEVVCGIPFKLLDVCTMNPSCVTPSPDVRGCVVGIPLSKLDY